MPLNDKILDKNENQENLLGSVLEDLRKEDPSGRKYHVLAHFRTVRRHRKIVRQLCFRIGLYRQGLVHDLSKYSWTEFSKGCRYFMGNRSPNDKERAMTGMSLSWLHHKGRNRHHFEYWLDYDEKDPTRFRGMRMPRKYVAEMFCDRVAASRIYQKENYDQSAPLKFFQRGSGKYFMHPETRRELGFLLTMLSEIGDDATLQYIRQEYLQGADIPSSYQEKDPYTAAEDGSGHQAGG